MAAAYEKLVIITKKTALEELLERFNTRDQARFYIEHMGGSFQEYQDAHDAYHRSLDRVRDAIPRDTRTHFVERSFLPTLNFGRSDLVVTVGPDGLVVNAAKYLDGQPVVAVNPDPLRIDGVLLPYPIDLVSRQLLVHLIQGRHRLRDVTMAKAALNDGQVLHAVNDLFIGQKTHVSARYRINHQGIVEDQSSSGVIISTGAGSSGWHRSLITGAHGIMLDSTSLDFPHFKSAELDYRFPWSSRGLRYCVREPFITKITSARLIYGAIHESEPMEIISQMPQNGVIFSDGVEQDYLQFNSGSIATIGLSEKVLRLAICGAAATLARATRQNTITEAWDESEQD